MTIPVASSLSSPEYGTPCATPIIEPSPAINGTFFSKAVAWFKAEGEGELVRVIRKIAAIAIAVFLAVSLIGIPVLMEGICLWQNQETTDPVYDKGPSENAPKTVEDGKSHSNSHEGIAPFPEGSFESPEIKPEQQVPDEALPAEESETADRKPDENLSGEFDEEEMFGALKPSPAGTWTTQGFVPGLLIVEDPEPYSKDTHDMPTQELPPAHKLFALKPSPAGFWKDGKFIPGEF